MGAVIGQSASARQVHCGEIFSNDNVQALAQACAVAADVQHADEDPYAARSAAMVDGDVCDRHAR